MNEYQDAMYDEEDRGPVVRQCEKCGTTAPCEDIPLMGYSLYLCRHCAAAMYRTGEAV